MGEGSKILDEFKTVKARVEYILRKYPEARNDDRYLWLMYVREFDPDMNKYIKYIPYKVLKNAVSFETLRRVRQKIQNSEGRYPPTDPEVARKRRIRSEVIREVIKEV